MSVTTAGLVLSSAPVLTPPPFPHFLGSFNYGDIILVPKRVDGPVWEGVFKGNVGKFPASHVVDTEQYSKEQIESMIAVEKQLAVSPRRSGRGGSGPSKA